MMAVAAELVVELPVRDPHLHVDLQVVLADRQDPLHLREVEADAAPDRDRVPLEAGARAPGGHGVPLPRGKLDGGGDIPGLLRPDDDVGPMRLVVRLVLRVEVEVRLPRRDVRLADRLRGRAADPCDADERLVALAIEPIKFIGGQREHRFKQPELWIADGKLCGVHAHRDATRPGGTVVPPQRPLAPLVELAIHAKSQRTGRDDHPAMKNRTHLSRYVSRHGVVSPQRRHVNHK